MADHPTIDDPLGGGTDGRPRCWWCGDDPAYVSYHRTGLHGSEGDNLGHVIGAVFVDQVLDNLATAFDTEIQVDIRHGYTVGV